MADRYVDYIPLDQVQGAHRNPKGHHTAGIKLSINRFGVGELPLLDERTGRLVAGHGRLDQLTAMHAAGDTPPDGVQLTDDGTWLIPVTRGWASRSDDEAEAYLVASNQLTVKGGWETRELAEMLEDLAEAQLLELTGFTDEDLANMLQDLDEGDLEDVGGGDADSVPAEPDEPVSKPGDVWLLGPHRLLCGDATNPDHLDILTAGLEPSLVYTDPPYGIAIVNSNSKVGGGGPFGGVKNKGASAKVIPASDYRPVAGDDTTEVAADAFRLITATYAEAGHVWWGGNHYAMSAGLPDASCWLVWDKENTGNFADVELAWTNHPGAARLFRHMWNGMLRASERGGGQRVHPTQKPVALAEWAFGVVDPDNDRTVVLDVFGGSGSTLIAAHRTDRTALLIEMEPHYVDVICRRFQEHTGTVPVLEATGEQHDFTEPANP